MTAATGDADAVDVTWHDIECGAYAADLALWSQLAREAAGPILELGAGTGRVALALAEQGHPVTALDRSPELLDAAATRAGHRGLSLETVEADARDFRLGDRFALICAPMQLAHLLGGSDGRRSMLRAMVAHLRPGGQAGIALLAEHAVSDDDAPLPLPDVAEHDGWVYSSQPVEVLSIAEGLEIRRLRQLVSPSGELSSELDIVRLDELDCNRLEAEAREVGMVAVERLSVPATADHVGSTICVLEAA